MKKHHPQPTTTHRVQTLSACVAYGMQKAGDALLTGRARVLDLLGGAWLLELAWWAASGLALAWGAFALTKHVAPAAAGSAIPDVKVTLSGAVTAQALRARLLLVKVLALPLVIGAGVFADIQGPMVHIGGLVAAALLRLPLFAGVREAQDLALEMLIAGTSCGLAAHFGTPVSGILFTLEIMPSYYSVRNYSFASLASIVSAMLSRLLFNTFVPPCPLCLT